MTAESHPSKSEDDLCEEDAFEKERRIRTANEHWNDNYTAPAADASEKCKEYSEASDDDEGGDNQRRLSRVHFSPADSWTVVDEDPQDSADLREARMNDTLDLLRWKLDKERINRVLSPVLTPQHRTEVFQRIYGDAAAAQEAHPNSKIPEKFTIDRH